MGVVQQQQQQTTTTNNNNRNNKQQQQKTTTTITITNNNNNILFTFVLQSYNYKAWNEVDQVLGCQWTLKKHAEKMGNLFIKILHLEVGKQWISWQYLLSAMTLVNACIRVTIGTPRKLHSKYGEMRWSPCSIRQVIKHKIHSRR